jgi:hypothetical protein
MKYSILAAMFGACLSSHSVLAADGTVNTSASATSSDDVCLQNNRLWSWQVVDGRTLSITDRTNKKFTVRVASGCVGLTNSVPDIQISGHGNLACVRRGDFVRFMEPNLGRLSCAITSIDLVPVQAKAAAPRVN